MRIEHTKRAISDLRQIAAYHTRSGNPTTAARIAVRLQEVIARIAVSPWRGRPVVQRPGVRVALLLSHRYKIFYRVMGDTLRIVLFEGRLRSLASPVSAREGLK
jgi:plasmid stabilization system protein ParE